MFESDFLDLFSRIPAWVVPALYVPVVVVCLGYAWWSGVALPLLAGQFAVGWLVWSLMEYWLHRTVFHWVPDTAWGEQFHFYLHGVHHKWFEDKYRLVMPPAVSVSVAILVYGAMWFAASILAGVVAPTWIHGTFGGIAMGVHGVRLHPLLHPPHEAAQPHRPRPARSPQQAPPQPEVRRAQG